MGLVSQVFDERKLSGLRGDVAIGHTRYSTTGDSTWENAQPTIRATTAGTTIALAHNGNLVNTAGLAARVGAERAVDGCQSQPFGRGPTDSELLTALLAQEASGVPLEQALAATCAQVSGAFSLTCLEGGALHAARDPHGFRPLMLGRLERGGFVIASETAALDIVGAHLLREVEPGEVVTVDASGLRSRRFAAASPRFCVFEYVYVARPDHRTPQTSVYAARRRMGALLADEAPVYADLVIPVPDSGTAAAGGYAEASGIPYAEGLVKNRYVGRTFIQPSQSLRQLGIRLKLNPLRDVLEGRRIVVVDDSIVRGNTSRQLVAMLRASGAAEVHLRITSPPVRHPCFYGIDMATRAELVGAGLSVQEIRDFTGADSLAYLSLDALVAATGREKATLCRACFDGDYPIPVTASPVAAGAAEPAVAPGVR
jgi:amidophosphoribosyltransferase